VTGLPTAIYIAGAFKSQLRLRHERDRIHREGLGRVLSTWLAEEGASKPSEAEAKRVAWRDLEEISNAELLILDTFDVNTRGGREVEFGAATGFGIETWIVGPYRNVFHHVVPRLESWDAVLEALWKERNEAL
jgi:hypothetical protein